MTAAFWVTTAQTVVFLALCTWAWWQARTLQRTLTHSELAVAHALAAEQHATRAALDARQMLRQLEETTTVLLDWWDAHAGNPAPEQSAAQPEPPATVPQPITAPDTVPTADAITPEALADAAAWAKREMDAIIAKIDGETTKRPQPRKRAGSTASGKGTP